MSKPITIKDIEEMEHHGNSILQIAANLRKGLKLGGRRAGLSPARKGLSVMDKMGLKENLRRRFKN